MMSIPGYAAQNTTLDFAAKFNGRYGDDAFRTLGRTGLSVSKVGFGTYRCHQNSEIHFQALQSALQKGCNIIDTSANYMDGFAESLIGDVLNQEIVWGNLKREEIVLVSKVGYIQGENMKVARKNEDGQNPFPEVVKYAPNVWHCIHPYFIRDQITRSLTRMHVDALDICLLHNPEYFLLDANHKNDGDISEVRNEFYRRIHQSFVEMERLVEQGLIFWYGISSNTSVTDSNGPDFVSLSGIWKTYKDVCAEKGMSPEQGHFAVIQFPFNWIEHQAFTLKNNEFDGKQFTVLELTPKLNLGVLANRPLNAIHKNHMIRLARYGAKEGINYAGQFREDLQKLLEIETRITQLIDHEGINVQINPDVSLKNIFQNADTLRKLASQEVDVSHFSQLITHYFIPLFNIGETALLKNISKDKFEKTRTMAEGYFNQFNLTAKTLRDQLDYLNYQKVEPLEKQFDAANNLWTDKLTLSQKALSVAASTPGVDVVLNGMRTPAYVHDSMEIMRIDGRSLHGFPLFPKGD
jgi:aryl-alcohol dehydrogenase-like predicted oxidoreductase